MKLALAGVGAFVLQAALSAQDDLLYDEIAQHWLDRNGSPQRSSDWKALLEQRFAHLALGVFDVYVPPGALARNKPVQDVAAALQSLLDAQWRWTRWVGRAPVDPTKAGASREAALGKWLARWTPSLFASQASRGAGLVGTNLLGKEMVEAGALDGALLEVLVGMQSDMRAGLFLGVEHELAGIPIVLFPERSEFVEFTCVVGLLDPLQKSSAWSTGLATWMEYNADGTRFVTLQYAAGGARGGHEKGVSVAERNPAALGELVAQVASRALFARVFSGGLDPALSSAMANALVIDLYGELDTRIDGDVRARGSQGTSTFIPGGNPNGGCLPPTSAENRWRGTKGKDHFVSVLSQVQKQSGKKGSSRAEKLGRFELRSDDGSVKEVVSAPFLGPGGTPPSQAVFPDYLELVRCYGVAFLHWLRLEGAGRPAESEARFAEFLLGLTRGVQSAELAGLFQEVYHQPLSAPAAEGLFEEATLEGRFLTWLARQD